MESPIAIDARRRSTSTRAIAIAIAIARARARERMRGTTAISSVDVRISVKKNT